MLTRQKIVLHLISQAGGEISRLRLVKCVFMLAQSTKSSRFRAFYEFVPYKYGPFSFSLYHELGTLVQNGYLLEFPHTLKLNDSVAIPAIDLPLKRELCHFAVKYGELSERELIDCIYSENPWFTVNAMQTETRIGNRQEAKCAVYTVGYEGLQIDGLLNLLLREGIQQLIDVRHNPVSRRYGFHKSTLSSLCQKLSIEYKHTPELGIPSELRANLHHVRDYERVFEQYEKKVLPNYLASVEQVTAWIQARPSVLLCMEADPRLCHRTRLARQVSRKTGLAVRDLREEACNTLTPKREFSLQL